MYAPLSFTMHSLQSNMTRLLFRSLHRLETIAGHRLFMSCRPSLKYRVPYSQQQTLHFQGSSA